MKRKWDDGETVYAVVGGVDPGIYKTMDEVRAVGGHRKGNIYKKMRYRDAIEWFSRYQKVRRRAGPEAGLVHIADYSLPRKNYVAIAAHYVRAPQDCASFSCGIHVDVTRQSDYIIMRLILQRLPESIPFTIVTNSERLFRFINYDENPVTEDFGMLKDILTELSTRRQNGQIITIDWGSEKQGNRAHAQAINYAVANWQTPYAARVTRARIHAWTLCARRLGLSRDVRQLIARRVHDMGSEDVFMPYVE